MLDGLENYQVLGRALELYREDRPAADIETVLRAGGALPHGQVGECVFAGARDRVVRFAGRLGRVVPRRAAEPLSLDRRWGIPPDGRLTGLTPDGGWATDWRR